MSRVIVAGVGGFLGAGKTTSLQAAASELVRRGLKVGIITNDQGSGLVDTEIMRSAGFTTGEVAGGCFCCKFDDLVTEFGRLLDYASPDVILAEAVGSCTDLSATVYQPLRRYYADQYTLAPLTILVEPDRIRSLAASNDSFPESVQYLFRKQLGEADLIILNKIDTVPEKERDEIAAVISTITGSIPVHAMSALTKYGVGGWVDKLLNERAAGERILEIDYDKYAQAEAALGWLNATVQITAADDLPVEQVAEAFMSHVQRNSLRSGMAIAHVKVLVATESETNRIALTHSSGQPQWSAPPAFPESRRLSLIVNARVRTTPDELTSLVLDSVESIAQTFKIRPTIEHIESFSPLPPKPQYRFAQGQP